MQSRSSHAIRARTSSAVALSNSSPSVAANGIAERAVAVSSGPLGIHALYARHWLDRRSLRSRSWRSWIPPGDGRSCHRIARGGCASPPCSSVRSRCSSRCARTIRTTSRHAPSRSCCSSGSPAPPAVLATPDRRWPPRQSRVRPARPRRMDVHRRQHLRRSRLLRLRLRALLRRPAAGQPRELSPRAADRRLRGRTARALVPRPPSASSRALRRRHVQRGRCGRRERRICSCSGSSSSSSRGRWRCS